MKPPGPKQNRYRGRIRAGMRSAFNHLKALLAWNNRFQAMPPDHYPNQLYPAASSITIAAAYAELFGLLAAKGPIPNRP
jgi:hypothetical protein